MGRNQQPRVTLGHDKDKNEYPGVEVRSGSKGGSIRIRFFYRGMECREPVKQFGPPSARSIRLAYGFKLEIDAAIARGVFDYLKTFPKSKTARRLAGVVDQPAETVGDRLRAYRKLNDIAVSNGKLSEGAAEEYSRTIKRHLLPAFGDVPLPALSAQRLRTWIMGLNVTRKTVRNILTPLRAVLADAVIDEAIPFNPLERLELDRLLDKTAKDSEYQVDPFNEAEVHAILASCEGQAHNFIRFAFWSGLRTSELIALAWRDVDFVNGLVRVRRAFGRTSEKKPKTAAGNRDVVLLPQAVIALQAQKAHTFLAGGRVFHYPLRNRPFRNRHEIWRMWDAIVKRAGVRYRNQYQTRHTYACMLLSRGEVVQWVTQQLGHTDVATTTRYYGKKYIPDPSAQGGYRLRHNWQ